MFDPCITHQIPSPQVVDLAGFFFFPRSRARAQAACIGTHRMR